MLFVISSCFAFIEDDWYTNAFFVKSAINISVFSHLVDCNLSFINSVKS